MGGDRVVRVLVCGSRDFDDRELMLWFCGTFRNGDVLIEGGARGADRLARQAVEALGFDVRIREFPADWERHGKAAGPIRNQQMLDEGKPDVVVAFVSKPLVESRGTADMVRRAKSTGYRVYVVSAA
jgi:hypothetical protein